MGRWWVVPDDADGEAELEAVVGDGVVLLVPVVRQGGLLLRRQTDKGGRG